MDKSILFFNLAYLTSPSVCFLIAFYLKLKDLKFSFNLCDILLRFFFANEKSI